MDTDWQDRQHHAPRDPHVQAPLEPITCPRHGPWMPRSIIDGDCPECWREMCDQDTDYIAPASARLKRNPQ